MSKPRPSTPEKCSDRGAANRGRCHEVRQSRAGLPWELSLKGSGSILINEPDRPDFLSTVREWSAKHDGTTLSLPVSTRFPYSGSLRSIALQALERRLRENMTEAERRWTGQLRSCSCSGRSQKRKAKKPQDIPSEKRKRKKAAKQKRRALGKTREAE